MSRGTWLSQQIEAGRAASSKKAAKCADYWWEYQSCTAFVKALLEHSNVSSSPEEPVFLVVKTLAIKSILLTTWALRLTTVSNDKNRADSLRTNIARMRHSKQRPFTMAKEQQNKRVKERNNVRTRIGGNRTWLTKFDRVGELSPCRSDIVLNNLRYQS